MLTIKPATSEHIKRITDIYNEAIQNTTATFDTEIKTLEDRMKWFKDHDEQHPVIVAEVDDEIIGYHHRDTDFLKMPKNYENKGAFRGAFGTTPVQHSLDAIIYPFITKYYNRYSPRTESGEGAFFYCAKTARQSYWKTIQWEQVFQNKDVPIVIQARLDGKPSWNTIPTNKPGGIYLFTSGDKTVSTYPIQAFGDTLELRIHFPYEHSAYTSGYWKERNIVKNIYVEYIQNTCIWQSQRKH